MPIYTYKAKVKPGEFLSGRMEAESERIVARRLKQMGHYPFSVSEEKIGRGKELSFLSLRKIGGQDIAIFTRHLSNLLNAGISLTKALDILMEQTENTHLVKIAESLRNYIQEGGTFSEALAQHSRVFSPLYVSMVHAGETGGMLEEVLREMAEHEEKTEELKAKVRSALAYPLLLAFVGITTVFVLLTFVIPRFVVMFEDLGQVLPLPTRMLIFLSGFMQDFWWLLLILIALILVVFRRYAKTGYGRLALDSARLKIPYLGNLIRKIEISRFARTLAALLRNGVPILKSLRVIGKTINNRKIAGEVKSISEEISEGMRLEDSLRKKPSFSSLVVNMIAVGEESGRLEQMLSRVADTYEQEMDRAAKTLTSLLEPAMILLLGGIVGFIVISILLPIFQINVLMK